MFFTPTPVFQCKKIMSILQDLTATQTPNQECTSQYLPLLDSTFIINTQGKMYYENNHIR
jgi:hypothetical protein